MRLADLDYDLPEELIAQKPLPERDASRLLVVDVAADGLRHERFTSLPRLLPPSLFVFNDTRVFPARLTGRKETGGRVEILLLRKRDERSQIWLALGRSSKGLRPGMTLALAEGRISARVVASRGDGHVEIELTGDGDIDDLIREVGDVPLPPYIRRATIETDRDRYQTVYAREPGAVAAPTAGLHFTDATFRGLRDAGHELAYVTLHVGPGTFRPVQADRLEDHPMHEETYQIPEATVDAIAAARRGGRAVVAVGTTVVRTLEAATREGGVPSPGLGSTRLFIRPPYRFRVVDHLVTNFHLPRSTLIALVMAFAGVDLTRRAYREAILERYRFYSYGDAMLIRGGAR